MCVIKETVIRKILKEGETRLASFIREDLMHTHTRIEREKNFQKKEAKMK